MKEPTVNVIATLVPEDERLAILPRFFGYAHMVRAEALVYAYMSKFSSDYVGGYWDFYLLSNGGFYMAPAMDTPLSVEIVENYYSGTMSADAAGIVATLFAVGELVHELQTNAMAELYHHIRDFALDHAEAQQILAAID